MSKFNKSRDFERNTPRKSENAKRSSNFSDRDKPSFRKEKKDWDRNEAPKERSNNRFGKDDTFSKKRNTSLDDNPNRNSSFRRDENRFEKKDSYGFKKSRGENDFSSKDSFSSRGENRFRRDENRFEKNDSYGFKKRREENDFSSSKDSFLSRGENRFRRDENRFEKKDSYGFKKRRGENDFSSKDSFSSRGENRFRRDEESFKTKRSRFDDSKTNNRSEEQRFDREDTFRERSQRRFDDFDSKKITSNRRERPTEQEDFETRRNSNNEEFESRFKKKGTFKKRTFQPNFGYERTELISRRKLEKDSDGDMRLNKYLAHCGLCSRRKAAELIESGKIKVNGKVATEIGQRVTEKDVIVYDGKKISIEEKLAYILLNKPRGFITTVSDEKGRKTVMELVGDSVKERVYPVGRLDRDTTGLLLLTNDGDLAQKLSHPSHLIKKVYLATLNKPLTKMHKEQISNGLELEDGFANVDSIEWFDDKSKDEVFVEVHIGKNRIVRRIFEHLGYEVEKLDRTYYAGLTKKDLPRGRFRYLTEREVIMLKHFTNRKVKKHQ